MSYSSSHKEVYSEEIPLPIELDSDVKVSSVHLILNISFINRAIVGAISAWYLFLFVFLLLPLGVCSECVSRLSYTEEVW